MNLMEGINKLTDFLMPPIEEEKVVRIGGAKQEEMEEEEILEEVKVVNGASRFRSVPVQKAVPTSSVRRATVSEQPARPQLTVHTTKVASLDVKIHVPTSFDYCPRIADDLKAGRATIVNYERVQFEEQVRICDFVNGLVYVLEGEVNRVSDTMVLYVPQGVNVYNAEPVALTD
ncbi:hypothetical protein TAMA11512_10910 [Selenomonas sp. TAMA-11512]|uniref:cell division protein SepF n=1 Tax=Selenomonas sp. TAMA-11512 TaxID=3095337 RepID=UPI00308F20A6|nr:hypothetical protein TAMA11512_10910 [Selenomonas sp. TAMA-11512]